MKAEIRVMHLQAKEEQRLQKVGERPWIDSLSEPWGETKPADTLILDF